MKTELTIEESLKREEERIFPSDMSEQTLLAVVHSRNCIEALKKQIPMKVEEIHVDEYFCPACGAQNNCGDICLIGDSYCPECGQALYQDN